MMEEAEQKRKADERARRVEAGEDPVEVDREIYGIIPESELAAQAEGEETTAATGGESSGISNVFVCGDTMTMLFNKVIMKNHD